MDYLAMLEMLQTLHATAGDEMPLARTLQALAAPHCDDCRLDVMGNVIVHKSGTGPKVMLAAHMDVPGLVVTHIEESGELRVGALGALSVKTALHSPYRFKNGVEGVLCIEEKALEKKEPTIQDLFLDIGAKDGAAAEALVQVGDTAMSALPITFANGRVAAPHANLFACLVLLDAMEQIKSSDNDLYFVFTTQENLGMRGAKIAAFSVAPDYAVTIDLTRAAELESKHSGSSKLAAGAAIKVIDSAVICHPQMIERLAQLAAEKEIPFQRDVVSKGESGGGVLQVSGPGVLTGGVGIPCRYRGSRVEMIDLDDAAACARLLAAFAATALTAE